MGGPHRLISQDLDADATTHWENLMGGAAARLPDEGDPEKYPVVRRPKVVQRQGSRRCSLGGVGGGSE